MASTCPWRQGRRSSRRSRAGRKQPRPVNKISNPFDPSQGPDNTYDSEILEGAGSLDVLQGLLEVDELGVNLALGLLGVLDSLGLESINGLDLAVDIVGSGLEVLEVVLDLINDSLVLQNLAVVGEVDGLGSLAQDLDLAAGVIVALLEGLERGGGLAAEAERARHLGPVDLKSSATLFREGGVSGSRLPTFTGGSAKFSRGATYGGHCDG